MKRDSLGRFITGVRRDKSSCRKQSETLKQQYASGKRHAWQAGLKGIKTGPPKGSIPWNKGLTISNPIVQANILSMARTRKERGYISQSLREKIRKGTNTRAFKQLAKERRSKQIFPRKDSSIERAIEAVLVENNITFEKHTVLSIDNGYHQVDFLIGTLVIECDGDYWHRRSDIAARDIRIDESLTSRGYKVLRLWESEIKTRLNTRTTRILQALSA
jgi:very-short-patch-repair endonuclease